MQHFIIKPTQHSKKIQTKYRKHSIYTHFNPAKRNPNRNPQTLLSRSKLEHRVLQHYHSITLLSLPSLDPVNTSFEWRTKSYHVDVSLCNAAGNSGTPRILEGYFLPRKDDRVTREREKGGEREGRGGSIDVKETLETACGCHPGWWNDHEQGPP